MTTPAPGDITIEPDECCCGSGMGDCGHAYLTISGDEEIVSRVEAYARALTVPDVTVIPHAADDTPAGIEAAIGAGIEAAEEARQKACGKRAIIPLPLRSLIATAIRAAAVHLDAGRVAELEAELAERRGMGPFDHCVKCKQPIDWRKMNLERTDGYGCVQCAGIEPKKWW